MRKPPKKNDAWKRTGKKNPESDNPKKLRMAYEILKREIDAKYNITQVPESSASKTRGRKRRPPVINIKGIRDAAGRRLRGAVRAGAKWIGDAGKRIVPQKVEPSHGILIFEHGKKHDEEVPRRQLERRLREESKAGKSALTYSYGATIGRYNPRIKVNAVRWQNLLDLRTLLDEMRQISAEGNVPLHGKFKTNRIKTSGKAADFFVGLQIGRLRFGRILARHFESWLVPAVDLKRNSLDVEKIRWRNAAELQKILSEAEKVAKALGLGRVNWRIKRRSIKLEDRKPRINTKGIPKKDWLPNGWKMEIFPQDKNLEPREANWREWIISKEV